MHLQSPNRLSTWLLTELFDFASLNADMIPSLYADSPESTQIPILTLKKMLKYICHQSFQATLAKAFRTCYVLIESYRQKDFSPFMVFFFFCLAG